MLISIQSSVASQALTQSAILLLAMLTDLRSPPKWSTQHSIRKVAPLSVMKTVLFASGHVGLVVVGRTVEVVEDEFEYDTVDETVEDVEAVDKKEDEVLEEEFEALPTKTAPLTAPFLIGVPALLFI